MAKLDLNQATREQLVDAAGLRPFVAEAVLKARDEQGGELADIGALKDALEGVRGIGPATLDQLGEVLKVGRGRPARPAAGKADDAPASAAKAGAEEPAEVPAQGVTVAAQGRGLARHGDRRRDHQSESGGQCSWEDRACRDRPSGGHGSMVGRVRSGDHLHPGAGTGCSTRERTTASCRSRPLVRAVRRAAARRRLCHPRGPAASCSRA